MEKKRQPTKQVIIDSGHAGQRIDNYLLATLKGVPRNRVYRLLRKGEVRVNKGRIKPTYRLQGGDVVRIPPITTEVRPGNKPSQQLADVLVKSVLYEDDDLLILNKPSGIAVHGGSGINLGLVEALRVLRPDLPDLELVHRLDRATSGCLVLAKHRAILLQLHNLLRVNAVDKRYLTLLKGKWLFADQRIDIPLRKNRLQSGERMVQRNEAGKKATSYFHPLRVSSVASLIEVRLVTGRMHQIRVHAAQQGHPVAGDDKYGDYEFNREMKKIGLTRLFLHASKIEFVLHGGGRIIRVDAPLPADLASCLDELHLNDEHIGSI